LFDKFKPTENHIRIDGYFYRQDSINIYDSHGLTGKKAMRSPIFFYSDGTVANYSQVVFNDNSDVEKSLVSNHKGILPEWGAFTITGDSIKIQTLKKVDQSYFPPNYYDVVIWEGVVLNDSTFIIQQELWPKIYNSKKKSKGRENMLYRFQKSDVKVDATRNWTRSKLKKG
jgi:hypothetical protein